MPDILVIGGGFAGVWSAAAAAPVREQAGTHCQWKTTSKHAGKADLLTKRGRA